ncbi:MAG: hypothetical protein WC045_01170 [Patescibacteria group bacterium]
MNRSFTSQVRFDRGPLRKLEDFKICLEEIQEMTTQDPKEESYFLAAQELPIIWAVFVQRSNKLLAYDKLVAGIFLLTETLRAEHYFQQSVEHSTLKYEPVSVTAMKCHNTMINLRKKIESRLRASGDRVQREWLTKEQMSEVISLIETGNPNPAIPDPGEASDTSLKILKDLRARLQHWVRCPEPPKARVIPKKRVRTPFYTN